MRASPLDHETDTGPRLRTYAAAGVPVYVLLNREDGHAYAYTEPVVTAGGSTRSHSTAVTSVEFGGKLNLPAPYPPLDTGFLAPRLNAPLPRSAPGAQPGCGTMPGDKATAERGSRCESGAVPPL
ncbi:hypothetical protein RM572_24790 [Streptomyces sp. DSM 42041]|uniref:Restriction endonuclease domain-containing protein n=1 Tax=Streptomyces hazeniae TaxID=3075538 RepID=A0ABU2NYC7_9ACTN|nr:hypothetical protein [Streptomyces sp. DSM 42041]MDT0381984.1 hypothetical protein [Streptomyces sp. DSM 42041]